MKKRLIPLRRLALIFCAVLSVLGMMTGCGNPCYVVFDSNGGSEVEKIRISGTTLIKEPPAPTKEGYTFVGWYSDRACTKIRDFSQPFYLHYNDETPGDTLYARWDPIDPDDDPTPEETPLPEENLTPKESPPPDNNPPGDNGVFVVPEQKPIVVLDKPGADRKAYTVTFDSRGGSQVARQKIWEGGYATAPAAPTKPDTTFVGWARRPSGQLVWWNFRHDTVTSNRTLYAMWKDAPACTVTFNSMGGSAVADQQIQQRSYIARPADPTRDDRSFDGWFTEQACVNAWNFEDTLIISDITLYAKWVPKRYTITYDSMGASAVASQRVEAGRVPLRPANPTWKGHSFGGWYREAACVNEYLFKDDTYPVVPGKVSVYERFQGTPVTSDMTLYAQWSPSLFAVTFNSRGGSPVPSQTGLSTGALLKAPAVPTRAGATFAGWYREAACTNEWSFAKSKVTEDITLYAKWTIPFTISPELISIGISHSETAVVKFPADYAGAKTGTWALPGGKTSDGIASITVQNDGSCLVTGIAGGETELRYTLAETGDFATARVVVKSMEEIKAAEPNKTPDKGEDDKPPPEH